MESPKTHNPASQPTEEKPVQPSADISLSPKEEELSEQMYPLIERSLFHSVTNNFQHLADIIFPVMGPAIRKAIQEAMKKLTESVNHSLENSLSPRSIAWRIQALFTGKSYGDIVLQHSFIYQVNHIFLIHKKTGLLIRQVSHEAAAERESDLISAMLSAIRDFIRDSFDAEESDEVQQIHVGNQAIWIEASPHAILAAVIEGEAPLSLRDLMVKTVEQIHREYTAELDAFEGETEPFALADDLLKKCLLSREKPLNRKKTNPLLILTLLIVALAGCWITNRSIQNHRWNRLITTLDDQPGIVVLSDHHRGRQFDARLLWDEEAIDPAMLIAHSGLKPERIHLIKIRYRSDDPEIAASRFRKIYHVPEKVKIIKTDSSLIIKGTAPWKWVDPFRRKAAMIPTVVPLDLSGLIASE
ncbi:MAG: hypothetical protein J7L89_00750, partial [Bacteroidales bacterium]|nr:hypothetical protein [Bacteroidales bacterium]